MLLQNDILALSESLQEKVVAWRRHIHQHPELSLQEHKTAEFVANILTELGVEHTSGVAGTGVVGLIKGKNPDTKCVALRADMDALPIQETNTHGFVSKNKGVMHACGHDFHTASLLGTAAILQEVKEHFYGTIKLIFQPSEEKLPGGASMMIAAGVLDNPKVYCIIGQHVSPELETGVVGFYPGKFMASADEIYLNVIGKGGHAAMPHKLIDPVLCAAQIITDLQQVISRKLSPLDAGVLSFGKIVANGATNIVPNEVQLEGTLRAMNESFREEAHQLITDIAHLTAARVGATCEVNIVKGYPCLINDEALTKTLFDTALSLNHNAQTIPPRMGAEDFAYYSQEIPACFYRMGTGGKDATRNGLHTSNFDVDENAFKTSVKLAAQLALTALERA